MVKRQLYASDYAIFHTFHRESNVWSISEAKIFQIPSPTQNQCQIWVFNISQIGQFLLQFIVHTPQISDMVDLSQQVNHQTKRECKVISVIFKSRLMNFVKC